MESQTNKGSFPIVFKLIVVLLIVYVLFLLYQAIYFNYKTSTKIRQIKADLVELDADKERLESLIVYYQTETFRVLEARKKLGMKMPGEKVVKVEVEDEVQNKIGNNSADESGTQEPNWRAWIEYLGGSGQDS